MSQNNQNKEAVVLLSGGLDSATCCAMAKSKGFTCFALTFDYGQRHHVELEAAKRVATHLAVSQHKVITIDLRTFGGSSLTSTTAVPKDREDSDNAIPNTYVPARNTIFLSYALAWAEVLHCYDIFIGVNAVDYSGYPDCRPEFIKAYESMANLATKAQVENKHLTIHTPLIDLTKADIIKAGSALQLDYSLTHSCYDPSSDGLACGLCDSCRIRKQGFIDAGVADPTSYQS